MLVRELRVAPSPAFPESLLIPTTSFYDDLLVNRTQTVRFFRVMCDVTGATTGLDSRGDKQV